MPGGTSGETTDHGQLIRTLRNHWREEMESASAYRSLAERESDPRRREILLKLADAEQGHARRWADRLAELDAEPPAEIPRPRWLTGLASSEAALLKIEQMERRQARHHAAEAEELDPVTAGVLRDVSAEDDEHARTLHTLIRTGDPRKRLDAMFHREKWHVSTGSWLGDAIYGVNDGLGAVFGIVSGVSGATGGSSFVLIAGLAGMIASALSMGSGAYLATKSEREVHEAELHRERREIEMHPEEEREELELIYQLRGFSPGEATLLADRMARNPEQMLAVLAHEELGLSAQTGINPIRSGLSSTIATAFGAFIPIVPFFFMEGYLAVVLAAAISIICHFAVGAAKSFITLRSWWVSGLEMTAVGVIAGGITYVLGLMVGPLV